MKKPLIALGITMLLAAGAYAQTHRLNRTNARTHDRSDAGQSTEQQNKNRPDKINHERDVDRNNTNNNTNSTGNGTSTRTGATRTGTSTNGVNTNGGTGTNGSSLHSNNPR